MTILAMVNAEKEGQIESKMMKARQLEEIREARQKEIEARSAQKKSKLVRDLMFLIWSVYMMLTWCWIQEDAKKSIRQKRKSKTDKDDSKADTTNGPADDSSSKSKGKRKSVSFA